MSPSRFKLVFFSPIAHTNVILNQLFYKYPSNVGRIGKYENCAFITPGTGEFRPTVGCNPFSGSVGELTHVEEHRVEVLV
ncbi:hypothetical protein BD410DRAFT_731427, partial [Rickenella mellea]